MCVYIYIYIYIRKAFHIRDQLLTWGGRGDGNCIDLLPLKDYAILYVCIYIYNDIMIMIVRNIMITLIII